MAEKQKIIIIGASGHGAEIQEYIEYENKKYNLNRFEIIGYLDKSEESYNKYKFNAPLLGDSHSHEVRKDCQYIIAIARIDIKKRVVNTMLEKGAKFATYIHPDTYISSSSEIGQGVVIAPNNNVGPNVKIGNFTTLNSRCSLAHDTSIGNFNVVSPNVCFSGSTSIGDDNFFGINSATIPSVTIGNRNKIAAGMTLHKNVKDDEVIFYRFKEKIIAKPK